MGVKLNIRKQRFGRLLVIGEAGKTKGGIYKWLCKCDCGNETVVRGSNLMNGNTMSCGCLNKDRVVKTNTIHGQSKSSNRSAEYEAWQNMNQRCYNPETKHYKNYGGRGIGVCEQWRHSFENFFKDMGHRPSSNHSLDRHPNINGNYEPSNCRWATKKQQQQGTRLNRWFEANGENLVLADWARKLEVSTTGIEYWINKGMKFSDIVKHFSKRTKNVKNTDRRVLGA